MPLRSCTVSCHDFRGVEHHVDVTANSLFEAVAQGLRIFRDNAWVDEIGAGLTPITVRVKEPEVEHRVLVRDFERWLENGGGNPADVALRNRLRQLLGK